MGLCTEFGPHIQPDCDHQMVPRTNQCRCPVCEAVCVGRFGGCAAVWASGLEPVLLKPRISSPNGAATRRSAIFQVQSEGSLDPTLDAARAEMRLLDGRLCRTVEIHSAAVGLRTAVIGLSSQIDLLPDRLAAAISKALTREHAVLVEEIADVLKSSVGMERRP